MKEINVQLLDELVEMTTNARMSAQKGDIDQAIKIVETANMIYLENTTCKKAS